MAEILEDQPTKINPDGLRYRAKPGGSPYANGTAGSTMSCFLCGRHKPKAAGSLKSMFNARQFVCFDCRPPKVDGTAKQKV